jgi:hypothetical protein
MYQQPTVGGYQQPQMGGYQMPMNMQKCTDLTMVKINTQTSK